MAGIGPATSPLPRECSTTKPHGLIQKIESGAGDEVRTRDIQFGKLMLYQLSYTRTPILNPTYSSKALWWREKDSNLRTQRERIYSPSPLTTRPPLQTEPKIMWYSNDFVNINIGCLIGLICLICLVPSVGFELTTYALQVRCSTN